MNTLAQLKMHYPDALAWQFGDSPELADELVQQVLSGRKTATCGSLISFQQEQARGEAALAGSNNIILNGSGQAMCVIRMLTTDVIRFCDVTAELARKEGEGDLSLEHWRQCHRLFFEREGTFSAEMELVFQEFELIEVV